MLTSWMTVRRITIAGICLASGFLLARLFLLPYDLQLGMVIVSISLAAIVGTGKLASP